MDYWEMIAKNTWLSSPEPMSPGLRAELNIFRWRCRGRPQGGEIMVVTQGGRDTAFSDVVAAIKECKGQGWQHNQYLIDALEAIKKVYQDDLNTRYGIDPTFGEEDHIFLLTEIKRVDDFLVGDMSLDELALTYATGW
jgi:hypothetical protein